MTYRTKSNSFYREILEKALVVDGEVVLKFDNINKRNNMYYNLSAERSVLIKEDKGIKLVLSKKRLGEKWAILIKRKEIMVELEVHKGETVTILPNATQRDIMNMIEDGKSFGEIEVVIKRPLTARELKHILGGS